MTKIRFIFQTITFIVFVFCNYNIFAQAVISPLLNDALHNSDKTETSLPVNIFLTAKPDYAELENLLEGADFETRVKTVCSVLKTLADSSQESLLAHLELIKNNNSDKVKNIQSFWISNMVYAEISTADVYSLSERSDIRYMDLNTERYIIHEPIEFIKASSSAKNNTEQSLFTINAHLLWEMGYTGRNTLFLSMDTGVFPDHPAISDNWAGNHWPIDQVWYGVRNQNPTDHSSSSHGTHTTGTVLGLDPATNDTIGIAYNAMWIASDPVGGGGAELLDPVDFMNVFQWVMDPDGNPETTDDVPRVINNSWGYDYELAAQMDACNLVEAEILIAIEMAGICSPFSAGNNGPGSATTGFPAMLAFNEVNPMAVGALNANNSIASFSSRGPTLCIEEEGVLKIKPEVSAPGVSIRSCAGNDSYAYLSGTSMACPHVSGALLLLAEAFPMASAYELKNSLYQTAVQLDDEQEDNVFGRGLIDAKAAFDFLALSHTPEPPVTNQYDLKAKIISPNDNILLCPNQILQNIEVEINNSGEETISNFDLYIYVNSVEVYHELIEVNLENGNSITRQIEDIEFEFGQNNIRAFVKPVAEIVEYDRFNNSDIINFKILQSESAPFYEDFTNSPEDFRWTILNINNIKTWEITSWGEEEENKALSLNFMEYGSRNSEEDFALMPEIEIPNWENVWLNLSYAYQQRLEHIYKDSLFIMVSYDCGISFPHILWSNGGQSMATVPGNSHTNPFVPESIEEFDTISLNLNDFRNEKIVIALKSINDRGSHIFIDMLEISEHSMLINEKPEILNNYFSLYPNPAADYINYKIMDNNNSDIIFSVSDITGKIVYQTVKTDNQSHIDISTINSGIYLIKAETEHFSIVKKIIIL